jgi:hypothetical protein
MSRPVRSLFVVLTGAVLVLAGIAVPVAPASAAEADTLHSLLNQERWANGQPGLLRNAAMDQVAADWAAEMARTGTMSHNPNYSAQIPAGWTRAGENVAQGYPDASSMHAGWMGSPGHRDNILGDYTDVGIAFISQGGTTWGVQVFARYPGHVGPTAPAAASPPRADPPAPPPPPPAPVQPAPPHTTAPAAAAPTPEAVPFQAARHRVAITGAPPWTLIGIAVIGALLAVVAGGTVRLLRVRARPPAG